MLILAGLSTRPVSRDCGARAFRGTGYRAMSIEFIGKAATCSSRISNTTHTFFVRTGAREPDFAEEPGVQVSSVSPNELCSLVLSGEFGEQPYLAVLARHLPRGF
jgi:ADP-ribose pyrophosphatase